MKDRKTPTRQTIQVRLDCAFRSDLDQSAILHSQLLVIYRDNLLTVWLEDERSIANKLEREAKREKEDDDEGKSEEDKLREQDATLPAISHGNKPSRGAEIDQQLREEEEAELKRKGKA